MEALQRLGQVADAAQVAEPGAARLLVLLDIGPAIAGVGKRNLEEGALSIRPRLGRMRFAPRGFATLGQRQATGVALGLADLARDVLVQALGFDHGHGHQAGEQHVVGALHAWHGPFGNGHVLPTRRARALGVGKLHRIGLPAGVAQHLVDDEAGGCLVHVHQAGGFAGAVAPGANGFRAGRLRRGCGRLGHDQFGLELLDGGAGFAGELLIDIALLQRLGSEGFFLLGLLLPQPCHGVPV